MQQTDSQTSPKIVQLTPDVGEMYCGNTFLVKSLVFIEGQCGCGCELAALVNKVFLFCLPLCPTEACLVYGQIVPLCLCRLVQAYNEDCVFYLGTYNFGPEIVVRQTFLSQQSVSLGEQATIPPCILYSRASET